MAGKTEIIQADDKGQLTVPLPRGAVDRIDIVDVDMVITAKSGERMILPGAALDAMTATPPQVMFTDGAVSSGELLGSVARVETPATSIPVMTSLTEFDQKRTEGKKNLTRDGSDQAQADESGAQTAQAQQVAPLPTNGGDGTVEKLLEKAEAMDNAIRKAAFDPAPIQAYEPPAASSDTPGSQPVTSKIPLYASLSEGNVVGVQTDGATLYGAGGPSGSSTADGIQTRDALQYGKETLTGTAGGDIIFADGFKQLTNGGNTAVAYAALDTETGQAPTGTAFYYAKEVMLNVAGYIRRLDSITVSGLPDGISVEGGTSLGGGGWSIPTASVVPTAKALTLVYDVTKMRALFATGATSTDLEMTVTIVGQGVEAINISKRFLLRFQDVTAEADITANSPVYLTGADGGWTDIYVMPTASAPHLINAGEGDNTVYGGNSADTINAGSGDDVIRSYAGNDVIIVGAGDNTIWAGNGDDSVTTLGGNDIIHAGSGTNVIDAGDGANSIDAGSGDDTITGGSGNDTISAGDGANIVVTGTGANTVTGGGGADTIIGGAGADSIDAGAGDDIVYGGAGNNNAANNGIVDGGAGTDWLTFNGAPATVTDGERSLADWLAVTGADINGVGLSLDGSGSGTATRTAEGQTDDVANIENIIGSQGNDSFDVSAYTGIGHILYGLAGNDTLTGADGIDTLYGGAGQDSLLGGAGNDFLYTSATEVAGTAVTGVATDTAGAGTMAVNVAATGLNVSLTDVTNYANGGAGADTIIGGAGNDFFVSTSGEHGDGTNADSFAGGDGTDTLDFSSYGTTNALDVDLAAGLATTGTTTWARFSSIERVLTSRANDTVTGSAQGETIWTGDGNDLVLGNGGDDVIRGGAGNDDLRAGSGSDSLYGEAGNDTLYGSSNATYLNGGTGSNTYYLYGGTDTIDGTDGTDTIAYSSNQVVGAVIAGTNYGNFINLSSTDYGISVAGALVADAAQSHWRSGNGTWTEMVAGVNGSTWQADNDGRGLYGNAHNDRYIAVETVVGTGYGDVLIGNTLGNWIFAGTGNDAVYGLEGADTMAMMNGGGANTGHDYFDGGNDVDGTADTYTASATAAGVLSWTGGDLINYSSGNAINYSLLINLDTISHDTTGVAGTTVAAGTITGWSTNVVTVANVEHAYGGNMGDFLYGSAANNVLDGGLGDDTLFGYAGDDFLYAGPGRDYIDGGAGTDWASFRTISASTTHGTYGAGFGVEIYLANADLDASGVNDQSGTWATYQARYATGAASYDYDTLVDVENLVGTDYHDRMAGTGSANIIFAEAGNDLVYGGAYGAGVIDTLDGGGGTDTLWFYGFDDGAGHGLSVNLSNNNGETILGATGWSTITINDGGSTRIGIGRNFENIQGSAHADNLTGTSAANTLYGGTGNDTLYGLAGNDTLYGGAGDDTLYGGGNTDILYGDGDSDTFSLTAALVPNQTIHGGSGNASTNAATENGTDTLLLTDNWNMSNLNIGLLHSIEAIDLRNGGASVDINLFGTQASQSNARTVINGILDSASNTSLHLYLDNGDRFNTANSATGAGMATNTNAQATYTYGGSNVVVHWGSG